MSDGIFPNLSIQEHKSFLDFDTKPKFDGPDFVPDFSEKINIMSDSLNLALHTLNLPESEYKILSIQDLKSLRKIDTDCVGIWALNILIYYKQFDSSSGFNKPTSKLPRPLQKQLILPKSLPQPNLFDEKKYLGSSRNVPSMIDERDDRNATVKKWNIF